LLQSGLQGGVPHQSTRQRPVSVPITLLHNGPLLRVCVPH